MHARGDGSFSRSAGSQTLKGAALILIAIVIGVVLLHTAPANTTTISTGTGTTPTTHPPSPSKPHGTTTTAASSATTAAPAPRPPSQVRVAVANGSGVTGLAARIRTQLNSAGYNTAAPPLNASAVATTSVYYIPGYQADALAVATGQLSLPASTVKPMPTPTPVPASQLFGVDVLVVAGADIGGASSSTTEAPAGNTIAPSPTVASHTTTTAHAAPHSTTTTRHA
jgi:hypothetical protein